MIKSTQNKNTLKSSVPNPTRKVAGSSRGENIPNHKKDRLQPDIKLEITELDKMKKELEAKRFAKEPMRAPKPNINPINRRNKEPNLFNHK